jgi:protease I
VTDAGAAATMVSPSSGSITGKNGTEHPVDAAPADCDPTGFDALVLPGGAGNADKLRMDENSVTFTKAFFDADKPVAVICHGGWILTEADVLHGRTLTSYPSLKTDLRNAGATWVDEEVHVDGALVSSRTPDDLPAFNSALLKQLG